MRNAQGELTSPDEILWEVDTWKHFLLVPSIVLLHTVVKYDPCFEEFYSPIGPSEQR